MLKIAQWDKKTSGKEKFDFDILKFQMYKL